MTSVGGTAKAIPMLFRGDGAKKNHRFLNTYFNDLRGLEWGEGLILKKTAWQGERLIMKIIHESQTNWHQI